MNEGHHKVTPISMSWVQINIWLSNDSYSLTLSKPLPQQHDSCTADTKLWQHRFIFNCENQLPTRGKTFTRNHHIEEVAHACQSNAIATVKFILALCFSFSKSLIVESVCFVLFLFFNWQT